MNLSSLVNDKTLIQRRNRVLFLPSSHGDISVLQQSIMKIIVPHTHSGFSETKSCDFHYNMKTCSYSRRKVFSMYFLGLKFSEEKNQLLSAFFYIKTSAENFTAFVAVRVFLSPYFTFCVIAPKAGRLSN